MRYGRATTTAWRVVDGESIVIDLDGQLIYGLNRTGGAIWQHLEGSTAEDLCAIASANEPQQVLSFLRELVGLGLAHVVQAPAESSNGATEQEPALAGGRAQRPQRGAPSPATPCPQETAGQAPAIVWREHVQRAGASCAFLPAQNPLCNQIPVS